MTLFPRQPGGEGRVRGADEPVLGTAHLTLPPLSAHACVRLSDGASPMRQGPLPLPPEGRRGFLGGDEESGNRVNICWDQAKVLTKPSRNSPRPFSTSGEISPASRIAPMSSGCVDLISPSIDDSKRPMSDTATVSR